MASFYADAENHKYYIDGIQVPSVTDICKQLYDFSAIPKHRLEVKSEIGTAVHRAIELMHDDNLDDSTVPDEIKGYLQAYERFIVDTKFKVLEYEKYVWSETYRYAGRLDLIGILNDEPVLIDIKTTVAIHPATGVQTAGYSNACDLLIIARYALQLMPDGSYKLQQFADNDLGIFLSALTLYNWRLANGLT